VFSSQSDEPPLPPQIDDTTAWPAPRPRAGWQGLLLLGALSFGLATLALLLLRQPESIASVWWANAVAAGFLVRHARAAWPGLLLVSALAITLANIVLGNPVITALAFMLANLVETGLMALMIVQVRSRQRPFGGPQPAPASPPCCSARWANRCPRRSGRSGSRARCSVRSPP